MILTNVDERGLLLMHCLEMEQPLAEMADNEARLFRALEERTADA